MCWNKGNEEGRDFSDVPKQKEIKWRLNTELKTPLFSVMYQCFEDRHFRSCAFFCAFSISPLLRNTPKSKEKGLKHHVSSLFLVRREGLEPPAFWSVARRSNPTELTARTLSLGQLHHNTTPETKKQALF